MYIFYNLSIASGISQLEKFNYSNNSISGEFYQKNINSKNTKNFSGKFSILKPNYFRWEYNSPYLQLILADGNNIWLYDKDLSQVIKKDQKELLNDYSPASILYNSDNLYKNYTLSDADRKNGIEYVKALPKNNNDVYKYIKIGMKNNIVYSINLKDNFGNNIEIIFKNIHNDNKLNLKEFKFKIPKNVDVLEN